MFRSRVSGILAAALIADDSAVFNVHDAIGVAQSAMIMRNGKNRPVRVFSNVGQ